MKKLTLATLLMSSIHLPVVYADDSQVRHLLREFDVGAIIPVAIKLTDEQQLFTKLKRL